MKSQNFKKIFISLLLLIASISVSAAPSLKIQRADGSDIEYYLKHSILQPSSRDLLVLIQGSDCNSVHHNKLINDKFSAVAPKADILTVEKYGINAGLKWDDNPERKDCPKKYILNDYPEQRVADYKQVLAHVKKVDQYRKVILLGGSEGAVIANILSAELKEVHFTVALNGGGRWFLDDVLHSIKQQSPSKEAAEESANGFVGFYKHIISSEPFELEMSGHGYQWWRNMFEIDQRLILEKITSPLLIIQGQRDKNVSEKMAKIQIDNLSAKKLNISYKVYPELDHAFNTADGSSKVNVVIVDIKLWLKQL